MKKYIVLSNIILVMFMAGCSASPEDKVEELLEASMDRDYQGYAKALTKSQEKSLYYKVKRCVKNEVTDLPEYIKEFGIIRADIKKRWANGDNLRQLGMELKQRKSELKKRVLDETLESNGELLKRCQLGKMDFLGISEYEILKTKITEDTAEVEFNIFIEDKKHRRRIQLKDDVEYGWGVVGR